MDFEYTPKVKEMQARLLAFMDEHIYPNEARFFEEIAENRAKGNAWVPTKIVEELKPKAQAAGLWNLFLPKSTRAPQGLSNLEYAPMCEIMGRVPFAAEIFNCSAPAPASAAQSPAAPAEGDAPDAAESKVKRPPTLAERNAEFAKRKAEAQAAEQKAAQEAARKSEQAANCDSARSNQAAIDSGTRMTEFDKSGQRVFLTDEQRAERSRRNQKILADCSKK
eukprot:gene22678-28823_t